MSTTLFFPTSVPAPVLRCALPPCHPPVFPPQAWEFTTRFPALLNLSGPPSVCDLLALVVVPPLTQSLPGNTPAVAAASSGPNLVSRQLLATSPLAAAAAAASARLHCALVKLLVGEAYDTIASYLAESTSWLK